MRFPLLLALVSAALAQPTNHAVQLVTSDIENFWKAYDASQAGNREEAFQKLYLDPGSPGLKDFVKLRIQSAKALATAIDQTYPKFYASVRPYTLKVESQRGAILKHLDRFRDLYPEAQFPPVYFVIGRLTSGGTTSDRGLLIGTEVNSIGPDVNTIEINPSFRRAMGSADHIPLIVVHELTHTQKKRGDHGKLPHLLDQSMEEGAADFMTELVADSSINAYAKEWAEPRRDELFQRFAADLNAKPNDTSQWLYNYGGGSDRPADLGYWIGVEICRSYYANAKDKREAIRNIVTLVNAESIVRNSRYASLLDTAR
jgi:hypothetical protein